MRRLVFYLNQVAEYSGNMEIHPELHLFVKLFQDVINVSRSVRPFTFLRLGSYGLIHIRLRSIFRVAALGLTGRYQKSHPLALTRDVAAQTLIHRASASAKCVRGEGWIASARKWRALPKDNPAIH